MQNYQGDVLLAKVSEEKVKDIQFKPLSKEGQIVAEGETTGHFHCVVVEERSNATVEVGKDANGFYFNIKGGNAVIEHNTHEKQIMTPGIWFVTTQFEYDEIEERKKVQD